MTTNKYVPDEEQVREAWRAFTGPNRDHGFGTWLARVRRDAKAEAWDECDRSLIRWFNDSFASDIPPRNPYRATETGDIDEQR